MAKKEERKHKRMCTFRIRSKHRRVYKCRRCLYCTDSTRDLDTRLKVLEYLAAGKPIVATFNAVEGLKVINGIHCLLHNDVGEAFVNSINEVINNEKLQSGLSNNALILSKDYDWYSISSSLLSEYEEFLGI